MITNFFLHFYLSYFYFYPLACSLALYIGFNVLRIFARKYILCALFVILVFVKKIGETFLFLN